MPVDQSPALDATSSTYAPVWVIHASETGVAEDLANEACLRLKRVGQTSRMMPLDALDVQSLAGVDHALFLASTFGDGEPPGLADIFVRRCMEHPAVLPKLHYGLLALGDRRYDDFCAFGRQLQRWLVSSGAHALFEPVEMDNEDPLAMRQWNERTDMLAALLGNHVAATS